VRKLALAFWAAQVLALITALIAALIGVESIVGTGPALSVIGLLLAAVTQRLGSWALIAFGLSGPLFCALCAALIAYFRWGPHEAERPIAILLGAYALAALPMAALALRAIMKCQAITLPQQRRVWQYGMKSLLVLMTAVCVLTAVTQFVARSQAGGMPRDEWIMFVSFAFVAVVRSGAVLGRFLMKR
jgi:hypothetical protein